MTSNQWAALGLTIILLPFVGIMGILAYQRPMVLLALFGSGLWIGSIVFCIQKANE